MAAGLGVALALALSAPAATTLATWSDTATASSTSTSLTLTAPALTCTPSGNSVVVTWQASTSPTLLTYTALIVDNGARPTITTSGTSRSVTVAPGAVTTLFGTTATLRITASLAGTAWTAVSDQSLRFSALSSRVSCP